MWLVATAPVVPSHAQIKAAAEADARSRAAAAAATAEAVAERRRALVAAACRHAAPRVLAAVPLSSVASAESGGGRLVGALYLGDALTPVIGPGVGLPGSRVPAKPRDAKEEQAARALRAFRPRQLH